MQPLKEVRILQKIKRFILPKRTKTMDNIFGNIELIPVKTNFSPSPPQNELPSLKSKQTKTPVMRHTIDYQQAKRRADFIKEIQQLKNNIKQTQQKNLLLFNRITSSSPDFAHVLFKSKNQQHQNYGQLDQLKLLQQKLLSQLDKLYEENCLLEKQLNRVHFIQQNEDKLKSQSFNFSINQYQFLRNVWHHKNQPKNSLHQTNKCEDLIEKLNKKVATVRFNINHIIKEEMSHQNNKLNHQIENDFITKSPQYQNLLRLYEQASMQLEDKRNLSWNNVQIIKSNEVYELQNQHKNAQIQNLNSKIKILESKAYQNEQQVRFLKDQLEFRDKQLLKLKNVQSKLQYVFNKPNFQNNQTRQSQNDIQIRVYNFSNNRPHKVENFKIDSDIQSLVQTLKNQAKLIEQSAEEQSSLNLYLEKLSAFNSQKSISLRKSLNDLDMNKIKTDRLSLIKKTNKLTQTLNNSNSLRRNTSREKEQRMSKTSMQQKGNGNLISFVEDFKEDSVNFPSELGAINFETDLKAKFVRTAYRNRRESLR